MEDESTKKPAKRERSTTRMDRRRPIRVPRVPSTPPEAEAGTNGAATVGAVKTMPESPPPVPESPKSQGRTSNPPPLPPEKREHKKQAWFETFFNDDYLRTVRTPHAVHINRQCDFIERMVGLEQGASILDVGCGLGLHAIELTRRGYQVVGLDLSLPMLTRASDEAQEQGVRLNFVHNDMRELRFQNAFDAVLCWGTTLGYFDDDRNRESLVRMGRALKDGGVLLIDVVNRDHVTRAQPNLTWFEGDDCVCMEETQFNYGTSRLEVKRVVMMDGTKQQDRQYSLRLYALNEIRDLCKVAGLQLTTVSGHEATPGVFLGPESPRIVALAQKTSKNGSEERSTGPMAKPPALPRKPPAAAD